VRQSKAEEMKLEIWKTEKTVIWKTETRHLEKLEIWKNWKSGKTGNLEKLEIWKTENLEKLQI
jgi:hypothetical protein